MYHCLPSLVKNLEPFAWIGGRVAAASEAERSSVAEVAARKCMVGKGGEMSSRLWMEERLICRAKRAGGEVGDVINRGAGAPWSSHMLGLAPPRVAGGGGEMAWMVAQLMPADARHGRRPTWCLAKASDTRRRLAKEGKCGLCCTQNSDCAVVSTMFHPPSPASSATLSHRTLPLARPSAQPPLQLHILARATANTDDSWLRVVRRDMHEACTTVVSMTQPSAFITPARRELLFGSFGWQAGREVAESGSG